MAVRTFQSPAAEVLDGTETADTFVSSNANLNAGDRANGLGGIDEFQYFADTTLTSTDGTPGGDRNFAAFVLSSVEIFTTTNDSGRQINFDLSSSQDITDLVASNSSAAVVYDEVTTLANIRLFNLTNVTTADVSVGYQAAVVAGANDAINLTLDRTNGDTVRIGQSTGVLGTVTNNGIESVRLTTTGNAGSTINRLNTDLTTLVLADDANSAASLTINQALNTTVRTITSETDGNVTLSWANNVAGQGVTYTGASIGTGINRLVAGDGNDIINTFAGNDVIRGAGGDDTINAGNGNNVLRGGNGNNSLTTGNGNDTIYAAGTSDTVDSGLGNDVIDMTGAGRITLQAGDGSDLLIGTGGALDASFGGAFDSLAFGGGFDIAIIDAGYVDAQFRQITELDGLAIFTGGTTVLQGGLSGGTQNAQNAGISTVYFISGTATADTLDASTYNVGMTIVSQSSNAALTTTDADGRINGTGRFNNFAAGGGDDTVTTGSAADQLFWRGDNNLTSADNLNAGNQSGAQTDALYLNGDTTLGGGGTNGFRGVEFVALESAVTSIYRQTPAADTSGNQYDLTITNANAPTAGQRLTIAGNNLKAAGALIDGTAVGLTVSENARVLAGTVTTFNLSIVTGEGFDTVTTSNFNGPGGTGDIVNTQGGDDIVTDGGVGNDIIETGDGSDQVFLTAGNNVVADTGGNNNRVTLGTGNDVVFFGPATGNDTVFAFGQLTSADTLNDRGGTGDRIVIDTRNYTDGDFSGVNAMGDTFLGAGFEILQVDNNFNATIGANAQRAGIRTVNVTGAGASVINAAGYTADLTIDVDRGAGGNDVATGGSGNDTFIAGTGTQSFTGNAGNDRLFVAGVELDFTDSFAGGANTAVPAGGDTVILDNSADQVNGVVDLTKFVGVEKYQYGASGDVIPGGGPASDFDNNSLTFGQSTANPVNTLTTIRVDFSSLTDANDTSTLTLNGGPGLPPGDLGVIDADYTFLVTGSDASQTTVVKNNVGTNNNIVFTGGAAVDIFQANGNDFGSTTTFNGNGGLDIIRQVGGLLTDDSFFNISQVEILTGTAAAPINAQLGSTAQAAGLTTITGTVGNDNVILDATYSNALTFTLSTGDDTFDASASAAAIAFSVDDNDITAADLLAGGSTNGDTLLILLGETAGATTPNITGVTGVETINLDSGPNFQNVTLTLDTAIGEVTGGRQTINLVAPTFSADVLTIVGGTATANITFNGGNEADNITLGVGNDIVDLGAGGDPNTFNGGGGNDQVSGSSNVDTIRTLGGVDQISGNGGNDIIRTGGAGDTVNGNDGADRIWTETGDDNINGGAGNDTIYADNGADILDGGAGIDTFLYDGLADSALIPGRDRINNFEVGTDVIDIRGITLVTPLSPNGTAITSVAWSNNGANFGEAQAFTTANNGVIEAVYQQDAKILWFDLNDDGSLNANDLQILLGDNAPAAFAGSSIAAGALNPAIITGFQAVFPA